MTDGSPAVEMPDEDEQPSYYSGKFYDFAAQLSASTIGAFFMHGFDHFLWVAEKTYKWSVPESEQSPRKDLIKEPPTSRPLPWLFFLPTVVVLGAVRMSISFFSMIAGRGNVSPGDSVSYIQSRRRSMRAFKFWGQRLRRIRQIESEIPDVEHQKELISKLSSKNVEIVVQSKRRANEIESQSSDSDGSEQEIYESEEDEEMTCNDLLNKYASASGDSSFELDPNRDTSMSSVGSDLELEMEEAVLELEKDVELISTAVEKVDEAVEVVAEKEPSDAEADGGGWQLQEKKKKNKPKKKDLNKAVIGNNNGENDENKPLEVNVPVKGPYKMNQTAIGNPTISSVEFSDSFAAGGKMNASM